MNKFEDLKINCHYFSSFIWRLPCTIKTQLSQTVIHMFSIQIFVIIYILIPSLSNNIVYLTMTIEATTNVKNIKMLSRMLKKDITSEYCLFPN